jgi:hypothetical protein
MEGQVPIWIIKRYKELWISFQDKEFTFEDASKLLKEKDNKFVSVTISRLRKLGWVNVKLSKNDNRKRLYSLKPIKDAKEDYTKAAFGE